jgi:predicted metalloprotease with PDZ domain
MAGPLGQYPAAGNTGGFSAAWLGSSPGLDLRADMAWAAKAFKALSTFFGDTAQRPYRFFLRVLPESTTSGGTAGNRSFMLQVPVRPRGSTSSGDEGLRSIVAHEMIHGWAGSFQGAGPWASEGLATYFTANLQRRLGLQPIKAFVAELNRLSQEYHGNPYRNATSDDARAVFWADKNGELLPNVRGALYFFALDAAIRQRSGGERSLDDILLDLFARRAAGETVSVRTFINALARELGRGIGPELDSVVVRGTKTVFVPPDAFGPCFTHSWTQVVVPDFAFDRRTPDVQTVVSLVPSSAAATAGLRNGDVVTTPVAAETLVSEQIEQMKLDVMRGGESLYLTYMTRPMVNESWEWSRVPDVSVAVCRGAQPSIVEQARTHDGRGSKAPHPTRARRRPKK